MIKFLDLEQENYRFATQLENAAKNTITSGRYIGGKQVETLESALCNKLQCEFAVGVASGLDALTLGLRAAILTGMLCEGDYIMVPANTYIASFLAITHAGLKPYPVNPDPITMNLSGEIIKQNLRPEIKAIMPVHLYGRAAWDSEMLLTVKEKKLIVIEDAAQSIGARAECTGLFNSPYTGALGHIGALSFYPTKNIGALGDGGAVITSLPEIAQTVRELGNYGSSERYHNIFQGYNSRLDPIQAAFINVKLDHLDELNADRFANVVAYNNTINNPLVQKPIIDSILTNNVWHQYVIRTPYRDKLRSYLYDNGVETDIHYPVPPHLQPCYAGEFDGFNLHETEKMSKEIISLPIAPGTIDVKTASDIGRLINKFKQ